MFKNLKKYKIILIDEKTLGVKEISSKSLFYSIIGAVFCFFIFLFISFYSTDINKFLSLKSILWHKSKNVELQNHIKSVHEGRRDHKCDHCGKSYSKKSSLKTHIKTFHEGRRDYECNQCGKSFTQSHHVSTHIKAVHDGERDYE